VSAQATPLDVIEGRARWCVLEGDSLAMLAALPDGCIDATITDPPYSSGGAFRGDRAKSTDSKYTGTQHQGKRPDFAGDVRDQRSFGYWCALWMGEALRCSTEDGRFVAFADWRQLSTLTDAMQAGGWIFHGIVPWDKGEGSRPTPGGFRSQCEFFGWATNGPLPPAAPGVLVLPGCFHVPVKQDDKFHQTGKPTALMREVVRVAKPGGVVLDPFAGSGTSGCAAILEGRRFIGVEREDHFADLARARCGAAESGADWRAPSEQLSLLARSA
jgi:site-specific DNA-methyltransferase (adenine-specific)